MTGDANMLTDEPFMFWGIFMCCMGHLYAGKEIEFMLNRTVILLYLPCAVNTPMWMPGSF